MSLKLQNPNKSGERRAGSLLKNSLGTGSELIPWLVLLAVPLLMTFAFCFLLPVRHWSQITGGIWQAFSGDHYLRWTECRWLMQGLDPVDVLCGVVPVPAGTSQLPADAGSFPWAYVLGIPLSFAFLPFQLSKALSIACNLGCGVGLMLAGCRFVFHKTGCRPLAAWTVLLVLGSDFFCTGFFYCNYGFLCGLLLIAAVYTAPTRPILAGICLMFAAAKPQLAALFYLALLLDRHWKPVLTGGAGVLCAWGAAAARCHTPPLTMLYETFSHTTSSFGEHYYFGIFTHTLPRGAGMLLSMAVCTVCMALGCLFLRRKRESLPHWRLFYYGLPAVFASQWTYSNPSDHSVLFLLYLLVILCFWDVIRVQGVRLSLVLITLISLFWMLQPVIFRDFLFQLWDNCIPGQFSDALFADLTNWVPAAFWWGICLLCAAPGRIGQRFRALL